jgi:hypothetical protein
MEDQILNTGLDMAMEWGEHWLQPIQERLRKRYPRLSQSELDEYNAKCQATMKYGHNEVSRCWQAAAGNEHAAQEKFHKQMLDHYPWVSTDNLRRLFSQGCYYAWKNGELM